MGAVKWELILGLYAKTAILHPPRAGYARGSCGDGLRDDVPAVEVPLVSMVGTVVSAADEVSRFAGRNASTRAKRMTRMIQ